MAETTGGMNTGTSREYRSWASVLGRNIAPSLNKNVLEVLLEKDYRGGFTVSDLECSNLLRKIGLDTRPGVEMEEVQICPNGRGVIIITLKTGVDIGKFCRHDVMDVTPSGTRAVHVKPAGRREVVVSVKGVHPNTREEVVLEYLSKFGKVVNNKVIYSVYTDGPLRGMRNGDRNYKVEIKPGTLLGSYHVIDGHKVNMKYPGQQQTCARCLEPASKCKGKGLARKCELEGGLKADFTDYILDLWGKIGYSPSAQLVSDVNDEHEFDAVNQQDGGVFTPPKISSDSESFKGVSIKGIPKDTDQAQVIELLVESGLASTNTEKIKFSNNGSVQIRDLENSESLKLIEALHGKRFFERKIFCNGLIPLTPEKTSTDTESSYSPVVPPATIINKLVPQAETSESGEPLETSNDKNKPIPPLLTVSSSGTSKPLPPTTRELAPSAAVETWNNEPSDWSVITNEEVARRHSISLSGRTPPRNSLAKELLASQDPILKPRNNTLMASIKDIQDVLSDFNSCNSTLDPSSTSSDEIAAVREEKNGKRKKKSKKLLNRDQFLKKPNTQISPK